MIIRGGQVSANRSDFHLHYGHGAMDGCIIQGFCFSLIIYIRKLRGIRVLILVHLLILNCSLTHYITPSSSPTFSSSRTQKDTTLRPTHSS